nr:immunoglobulin heavy chain junction region [Macaca mulatta]MOV89713.1 immunoglobulin heavy chain junction region [Macaca mulatta]
CARHGIYEDDSGFYYTDYFDYW